MTITNPQRYPCNLYIINVEDIIVCLRLKVFNSDTPDVFSWSKNAQVTEKPQLKINGFQNYKH